MRTSVFFQPQHGVILFFLFKVFASLCSGFLSDMPSKKFLRYKKARVKNGEYEWDDTVMAPRREFFNEKREAMAAQRFREKQEKSRQSEMRDRERKRELELKQQEREREIEKLRANREGRITYCSVCKKLAFIPKEKELELILKGKIGRLCIACLEERKRFPWAYK